MRLSFQVRVQKIRALQCEFFITISLSNPSVVDVRKVVPWTTYSRTNLWLGFPILLIQSFVQVAWRELYETRDSCINAYHIIRAKSQSAGHSLGLYFIKDSYIGIS